MAMILWGRLHNQEGVIEMHKRILVLVLAVATTLAVTMSMAAQAPQGQGGARGGRGGGRGGFNIPPLLMATDAWPDGGIVPEKYAGRGGNVQPGFKFTGAPPTTVTYAIIFHDIDAVFGGGTDDVLHWMVWNIPAEAGGIPEGKLPEGTVSGTASIRMGAYFGPGAPAGERYHHYIFELYALNAKLDIPASATRAELLAAMAGKIVAKSGYVGRYRGTPPAQ
jgi:Raf kinase inhibitor-like YbhB/YbcL family protein